MTKLEIIQYIIKHCEGGYTNDPDDLGGETNYGITKKVAIENGYTGPMISMPIQVAEQIYIKKYWDTINGDSLIAISDKLAFEVIDTGINTGIGTAAQILQTALNALNNCETLYSDLKIDGNIGPATIQAIQFYLKKRSLDTLLKALNVLQGAYYIDLTIKREKNEKFLCGWLDNRVKL